MSDATRPALIGAAVAIALAVSARDAGSCDDPRKCARPSRGVAAKAHTDHNPKHGGIFYMASNGDYHMECVYLRPGVLKIYLYDKYTQPIQGAFFKAEASLSEAAANKRVRLDLADDGTLTAPLAISTFPFAIDVRISCPKLSWAKALDDTVTFPFDRYSD